MRNWRRFLSHRYIAAAGALYALVGLSPLGAAPIQWTVASGGNGHFYEFIDAGVFTSWTEAQTAAQGVGGYLATITSAAENAFIASLTGGTESYIGATDASVEGAFEWVTAEAFGFTNWAFGEPNDDVAPASPTGEDFAIINPPNNPLGTWNDLPDQPFRVTAYVVELDTAAVPEPSTLWLFGTGAAFSLATIRRCRSSRT
jgi:hypothetical protein